MDIIRRVLLLVFGVCLLSLGIVLTIHSGAGASPWDVFHLGVSNVTGLTVGKVSQLVGVAILIMAAFFKEYPGWGTIFNTYFIGYLIDALRYYKLVPVAQTAPQMLLMLLFGILFMGWGTSFYLLARLGSGPRDSLMLGLLKKFRQPVWKIRLVLETAAMIIGYLLGGLAGIGTVLTAVLIGFAVQSGFHLAKKRAADIKHRVIWDDYQALKNRKRRLEQKTELAKEL